MIPTNPNSDPSILKGGVGFDAAHSKLLAALWDNPDPKAREECKRFALFCAGIVDSAFHNIKVNNPKMVEGMIGFGLKRQP
jgi:hypothetical protein